MVGINEVGYGVRFYIFQSSVDVNNILAQEWHKFVQVVIAHGNNDLFA